MNEKLSALMDGELDRSDALAVIKSLGQDAEQRSDWDCYHLIGDVLRGESVDTTTRRRASAESIFAKLASEPTVLAPVAIAKPVKAPPVEKRTRLALAMAASVVTVSAIGVVAFKQQSVAGGGSQVAQQQSVNVVPVSTAPSVPNEVNVRVNDYLVVHRQFANGAALQAAAVKKPEPRQSLSGQ
jgi:sigma-E factor negative regulatory protein RseA